MSYILYTVLTVGNSYHPRQNHVQYFNMIYMQLLQSNQNKNCILEKVYSYSNLWRITTGKFELWSYDREMDHAKGLLTIPALCGPSLLLRNLPSSLAFPRFLLSLYSGSGSSNKRLSGKCEICSPSPQIVRIYSFRGEYRTGGPRLTP